ncbi:MAG TPA: AAA family ATPase [Acidimicrobiales bacterium]|nr:AAA family ATPase [Acidimicrobiales bacterium]
MSKKRGLSPGRLKQIRCTASGAGQRAYPFSIPAIAALDEIDVAPGVTFFAGENGTGKSTLVEALAVRADLNPEGGSRNLRFATRPSESSLHHHLELVWERRPSSAFFLRAETFYNTATAYEGVDIRGYHERSHGESFLDAFASPAPLVRPGAFVLMDEPESALSVFGQLKLMRAVNDLVSAGSQFIVATHSPILLAFPDAWIYRLHDDGIDRVTYKETEAYQLTKSFVDAPERFLRHLLSDD